MKVLIVIAFETHMAGFIHRAEREVLAKPKDVTVLNEHGDITIGHGRKAMTYMGREVLSVTYIR